MCFIILITTLFFLTTHFKFYYDILFEKKNNLTSKMKLYTTREFISNKISSEKKKKKNNLTTKMKLYTTSQYMNNDISFEKNKKLISLQK